MSNKANKIVLGTRDNPWQSAWRNSDYYWYYYDLLYQVAAATLKWEGMPEEIDLRFLNMTLFSRGLAVFFHEQERYNAYFAVMGTPSGQINMYNNPTGYTAFGAGDFHYQLTADECVPIWLNYRRKTMVPVFDLFARRLANIDRTIEVNLAQHKTPALIECDERVRLSVDNLIKQWQGGEPIIVGNEGLAALFQMHYVTNDAPYLVDKLLDAKNVIFNEFLTVMGVDNSPVDKAAQVQTAEVESNNVELSIMGLTRLDTLREACQKINRKYGLDVDVNFNVDFQSENWEIVNTMSDDEGVDNDGLLLS